MRRTPESIVASYDFDPSRREIYVEGEHDRAFLEYLSYPDRDPDAVVVLINEVEIPDELFPGSEDVNGNRTRLLWFLKFVKDLDNVVGLVDVDDDHIRGGEIYDRNVIPTDFRDLEAYFLDLPHVGKAFALGLLRKDDNIEDILDGMNQVARFIAAVRLVSSTRGLKLPVNKTNWLKHVKFTKAVMPTVDKTAMIRALLQNGGRSLQELNDVLAATEAQATLLSAEEPRLVARGKDALLILAKQVESLGIKCSDALAIVGPTFERSDVSQHPQLSRATSFLRLVAAKD